MIMHQGTIVTVLGTNLPTQFTLTFRLTHITSIYSKNISEKRFLQYLWPKRGHKQETPAIVMTALITFQHGDNELHCSPYAHIILLDCIFSFIKGLYVYCLFDYRLADGTVTFHWRICTLFP